MSKVTSIRHAEIQNRDLSDGVPLDRVLGNPVDKSSFNEVSFKAQLELGRLGQADKRPDKRQVRGRLEAGMKSRGKALAAALPAEYRRCLEGVCRNVSSRYGPKVAAAMRFALAEKLKDHLES